MKHSLIILSLLGGFIAVSATEAGAVVCARGVYRAGCVGPYGAVGVRRGVYRPVIVRGAVYARKTRRLPRPAVVKLGALVFSSRVGR
jgi:hypothetical protein